MHPILKAIAALAATLLLNTPGHADGMPTQSLAVGRTGIQCIKAPCPWRGIFDSQSNPADGLLWSGPALPRLDASPQNAQRITQAWTDYQCLLVVGEFDGTTLHVVRITGSCS